MHRKRWGVFSPKRTDDLREDCKQHVGKRFLWRFCWIIERDDGWSEYTGMSAWIPQVDKDNYMPVMGWIPECDIEWEDDGE